MNRNLLKTLLIATGIFLGAGSLWADDDDEVNYQLVKTIDFEDASTYTSGWSWSSTSAVTVSQGTLSDDTYYYTASLSSSGGTRTATYTISEEQFLESDQWKLEFDFAATSANDATCTHTILDADGTTIFYMTIASWATTAYIYDADGTELGTITVESAGSSLSTWYTITLTGDETNGVTLNISDADGTTKVSSASCSSSNLVPAKMTFALGRYNGAFGIDEIKMYIVSETEIVNTPTASITAVNGTERTITMDCETANTTIYYSTTEDGDATAYSDPITITENTTFYIYATTETGGKSETATYTFSAGESISLNLSAEVTAMTEADGVYCPTYTFTSDNSSIELTPTATLTAMLDGTDVDDFDGTYTFTADGTLIVTASAEGYASKSLTIDGYTYTLANTSTDLSSVSADDVNDGLIGDGWTVDSDATRWGSWSQTGGVDTDLNANSGASYYTATNSSTTVTIDDFVTFKNAGGVVLLFGYGIGSNSRANYAYISGAIEGSIASYAYCLYGGSYGTAFVYYTEDNATLQYTLERSSTTVSQVKYYVPAKEVNKTIGSTGYASFSSEYSVEVPEGVYVYKATEVGTDAVTLTLVDGVTIIPANTGVILYSETTSTDYSFLVTYEESEADFDDNILIASSEYPEVGTDDGGYTTYYGLKASAEEATFAPISTGTELSGNKAYLGTTASEAKSLKIVFGSTNGISEISSAKSQETGALYNLQGVRVENPQKGLYIRDGKKVIIK